MKKTCFFLLGLIAIGLSANGQIVPVSTPEVRFGSPNLPPLQGVYVTPAQFHAAYANGIVISNIRHRRFTESFPPPAGGVSTTHSFGSSVEFDRQSPAGGPGIHVVADALCTVIVTPSAIGTQTFDTEMLALNISGGGLPALTMIRESPTFKSTGRTTVRPAADGNGSMISSFFDIFTEISLDGGQTWSPAQQPAHVELQRDVTTVPAITVPSNLLPPPNDLYISPAQFHVRFANGIIIRDIRHSFFTRSLPPPPPGVPQIHEFGSQVDYQISTDRGLSFRHGRSPAPVVVQLSQQSDDGDAQIYDTEMLQLDLQGGDLPPNTILRESPTRQSTGGTAIQRNADGTFRIGSFFDIFVELSVDGGLTWSPGQEPAHVELVCEAPEVPFPDPLLPPPTGAYLSGQRYSGRYLPSPTAPPILVSNIIHRRFTGSQPPPPGRTEQIDRFDSEVEMMFSKNGGATWNQVVAPAIASVLVRSSADDGATRFFDTEMLSLNISGGGLPPGVMVRESPTKQSLGRTSMRMVPDPTGAIWDYVSSFFDIFTELSLDNGATWLPSLNGPKHVAVTNRPVIPPITILCPPDMKVGAIAATGASVIYPSPTVNGGCPPYSVVCNPPSGSVFPIGTTTVTCTVSDTCNNSRTCSFRVTVFRRFVEVDKMPYGTAQLSLRKPDGTTEVVTLAGPTTVEVYFDGEQEGDADDSDNDGLDDVPSRMTEMDLRGNSLMGAVQVTLDPERPSMGGMEEQANPTPGRLDVAPFAAAGAVNSFFDVFTEIRVAGRVLRPASPLHMQSIIRHKPPAPGDTYVNPFTQPIELLDENGGPTGIFVVREVHTPNPEKEIDRFPLTTADLTIQMANGTETVHLTGPTTVEVSIAPDGGAADTDGDGRDQAPAHMTELDLTGPSSAGLVHVTLTAGSPTLGEIEERVNNTPGTLDVPPFTAAGVADSFFDVFVDVEIGGLKLHNKVPLRMASVIRHKPPAPGDEYVNPFTQPVELLDANGNRTGIFVIREVHTPNPDCRVSITCPPNMKVGAIAAAGVVVNYPAPTVVGNCPPIAVVCLPPSGSVFPIGTTTVTCTASDRAGNSAKCEFRVTVFRRFVEVDKMPYGTAQLSLRKPDGTTEVVTLAGPTTVEVYFDGEQEGKTPCRRR